MVGDIKNMQYHRVYARINMENIRHNLDSVKNKTGLSVKVMPVIKADGYGHGAVEIAKAIYNESDCFGVAVIEEALELRNAGIDKPILILGTLSPQYYRLAIENDIIVSLYNDEYAQKLSEVALDMGKKAKFHLKVNTGMNRIGVKCDDDGFCMAKRIISLPNLLFDGIFTHYATADEADKTFSDRQLELFEKFCLRLEADGINTGTRHICNSAGIMETDTFFDMVRPGIILYGLYPSDEVSKKVFELKPALELRTHVSCVKTVDAGEGISYGRTYITDSPRVIATIPVGYADGYPRLLSGCGRVIIHGCYAPIVGRICMDQFMVDVTGIDGVCEEDDVVLIGSDGNCTISADEIAELTGTINYEVTCSISKRVPRIYE